MLRFHLHKRESKGVPGALAPDAFVFARWVAEEPEEVAAIPGAATRLLFSHAASVLASAQRSNKLAQRATGISASVFALLALTVLLHAGTNESLPALEALTALGTPWSVLLGGYWANASKREKRAMTALEHLRSG